MVEASGACTTDDTDDFRTIVSNELREDEERLERVISSRQRGINYHLPAIALLLTSAMVIFLRPQLLLLWLIVAFLLYSYNFIILMLPTTTRRTRPKERGMLKEMGKKERLTVVRLLLRKKWLAIEMGLTIFLGGMVPLTLSFCIIFSTGLFFTIYFAFVVRLIAWQLGVIVATQIIFILLFYLMVYLIEPQSQGITDLARALRKRYGSARGRGWVPLTFIMAMIVGSITIIGTLIVGAIMLPGATLVEIFDEIMFKDWIDVMLLIYVVIAQLVIMRHFQSMSSKNMAINILSIRVDRFRADVLHLFEEDGSPCRLNDEKLLEAKRRFYSIAVYDLIYEDFFGHAPVYLVGPRLKYLLDEDVLKCF